MTTWEKGFASSISLYELIYSNIYNVQLLHVKEFASPWKYNHTYDIVLTLRLAPFLVGEIESKRQLQFLVLSTERGWIGFFGNIQDCHLFPNLVARGPLLPCSASQKSWYATESKQTVFHAVNCLAVMPLRLYWHGYCNDIKKIPAWIHIRHTNTK